MKRRLGLLMALSLTASACATAPEAREGAKLAGDALAGMKANAAGQQSLSREQRDAPIRAAAATAATTEGPRRATELSSEVWRIGGTPADQRKLRTLETVRSKDQALLSNPYLLIRPADVPANPPMVAVDTTGLSRAIEGVARLADDEGFSREEAAALLFDVVNKTKLPSNTSN
ncbi:MAG TPA: hypothetical protein VES39_12690 [Rhodospirillales bacterium]|nr:hypothetical protein [Rhodospirillales bacterium]